VKAWVRCGWGEHPGEAKPQERIGRSCILSVQAREHGFTGGLTPEDELLGVNVKRGARG